jgi:uncharacterized membrane protein YjjP (DUF1212 family)
MKAARVPKYVLLRPLFDDRPRRCKRSSALLGTGEGSNRSMSDSQLHTNLLLQAGRLLLEYNESTAQIHRTLKATAKALTGEVCHVSVSYRGLTVSLPGQLAGHESIQELRYSMAAQARVHEILNRVRQSKLEPEMALSLLRAVECETPRYSRWLSALVLGLAASALAGLLGADAGAAAVAGPATALGLLARQELGKRHYSLLLLPFVAALIGAIIGSIAIRLGWTQTPALALIVPALMVVPGPHLINGLFDLIDNHVPMSLSRFGLAGGILFASALGILVGVELMLPTAHFPDRAAAGLKLNLLTDMILAGIVTCGFAVFYNTPWQQLWMVALGGMAGHGLRFLALKAGCWLETATFLGGFTVGGLSIWMTRSRKTPIAVVAFAGAVTMIPGLSLYRALGGALQLARQLDGANSELVAGTLGNGLQGGLVVVALALGVILGARAVGSIAGSTCSNGGAQAAHLAPETVDRPLTKEPLRTGG